MNSFDMVKIKTTLSYYLKISSQLFCHRLPERTFRFKGHYFPVCSRCTGMYLGMLLFFIFNYFNPLYFSFTLTLLGFLMILPTAIDGLTQLFGLRESNNYLRFFSGLIGGIGLLILVISFKLMLLGRY
ncbi:MAG: hypothetical protein PWQ15_1723 [Methanobacterium sp.]|nr:hypothetical protein [Methanobacterium sp.]